MGKSNTYNVIAGTAGHVDHGKTRLIKALTGVDTDRLKEEKNRGITIELGFAEMPNDRNLNIGVIDVPGHERFIKNMLAGIGGIDMALLIIAADEGVMPQTVEHFEIIKTLGIKRGIIVITKIDLVEEEWLEMVRYDISERMVGSFLETEPIVEVSAQSGHSIPLLKKLICDIAEETEGRRLNPELFRVPIDRVFTIDGFGTVVTGTLIEVVVTVGDEVAVYPEGKQVKIRNLQVHGNMVERAYAGQRTALNLTGAKKEELRRGDVLAVRGGIEPSKLLDVKIDMFKDSPRALISGTRLHLYCGSAEVLCKATLLDADRLESGQSGFAQLRLEEAVAVRKNDRFILRFYSPVESIGGGIVINTNPARKKRFHEDALRSLEIKGYGSPLDMVEQALLEESGKTRRLSDIRGLINLSDGEMAEMIDKLIERGKVIRLSENIAIHSRYWDEACGKAKGLLEIFHEKNPFRQGMPKEEFRKRLGENLFLKQNKFVEILAERMIVSGIVTDNGNTISLIGFSVTYAPHAMKLKEKIENEYKIKGVETPETGEFVLVFQESERALVNELSEALTREGSLVKLAFNCYIHADSYRDAVAILKNHMNKSGKITLSEYRDLLGTSRKYAIRLLEYLDKAKVTRLENDTRFLI